MSASGTERTQPCFALRTAIHLLKWIIARDMPVDKTLSSVAAGNASVVHTVVTQRRPEIGPPSTFADHAGISSDAQRR
jgi:hypothetical protein